jgi:hypothetical protein
MGLEGKSTEEIERMAAWADRVLNNKDTRADALRLTQKIDPNYRNPEIELDDRIKAATAESDKKLEKMQGELHEERLRRNRTEKKQELTARGYDIDVLEKVMVDNQVSSYEGAIKIFDAERRLAPATPPVIGSGSMEMPDVAQDIMKNPTKWAQNKAAEVLNEIQGRGRAA